MKQDYFIVVLAHSLHGRLRRIHVPHSVIYAVLALALVGCFSMFGFISSYARMAWKVANYNSLKREADALRTRYAKLQKVVNQTNEQMASLQLLANEFSVAYGLKRKLEGPASLAGEGRLVPTFTETVQEYNYLRTSSLFRIDRGYARRWHQNVIPSLWPVDGALMGPFGQRIDPFSGEGTYHTGVDISAHTGTSVRATADGVVTFADHFSGYGRLVIIDHGNGIETYYAHLCRFTVVPGQEIRRGELVGAVGTSGRVTAPHLHYEVRVGEAPVNPYRYLAKAAVTQVSAKEFPF
jgi:murein DD-endopeptidase MepM/ murein hydrolase activator NlpD